MFFDWGCCLFGVIFCSTLKIFILLLLACVFHRCQLDKVSYKCLCFWYHDSKLFPFSMKISYIYLNKNSEVSGRVTAGPRIERSALCPLQNAQNFLAELSKSQLNFLLVVFLFFFLVSGIQFLLKIFKLILKLQINPVKVFQF